MKYHELRDEIKSGDVLAWTHREWKTFYDFKIQMVRFFTQSEYSHVGIAYVMGGRVWVLESVTPLIRIVPLSNLLPCYWANLNQNLTPEAELFALSLVGKGEYSQLEAMRAFFGANRDANAWECAEYVKVVLEKAGVALNGRAVPSDVVQGALQIGAKLSFLE